MDKNWKETVKERWERIKIQGQKAEEAYQRAKQQPRDPNLSYDNRDFSEFDNEMTKLMTIVLGIDTGDTHASGSNNS